MRRIEARIARLHALYPRLIDLRLERLQRLLAALNNPQDHLPPAIHVAGTNGKGSVCAFARSIAAAAGLRAHVYTSPHLVRFNERFVLAGREVDDDTLAAALDEVERTNAGGSITVFEAMTAAAFLMFARTPADIAIIEVGLGGLHDATNVFTPAACAITSISHDHQEFFGAALSGIAREKAGIIKSGVPVVTAALDPAAAQVVSARATAMGAPELRAGRDWHIAATASGIVWDGIALPAPALAGAHQVENAGIAMTALRAGGFSIGVDALAAGLRGTSWPARLQRLTGRLAAMLPAGSALWLDGAHNPGGAAALAAQLAAWPGPTTLILGMKRAKDVAEVVRLLRAQAAAIYAVAEPTQHLALPVADIIEAAGGAARPGPDVRGALIQITAPTRVLICGSLYLAGEVLKLDSEIVNVSEP
jgi:dihydrofolate synthase/folylpolyglutamate synthase